jgi:hypothetical protein
VNLQFANQNINATADNSGKWMATLNAMSANKNPQVLTIKSGTERSNLRISSLETCGFARDNQTWNGG